MGDWLPAAVLRHQGAPVTVEQIELIEPGPGQVRVRLAATGLCHSDLSLASGVLRHETPFVLGHEGAGRVVALGPDVADLQVGDPVVLNWAPACGQCWFCQRQEPYLCEQAQVTWARPYGRLGDGTDVYPALGVGGFAPETVIDARACIPIPADVPLVEAALLGCAVLTGVGAVRNAARVRSGESVVIVGLGGVGLAALQGARMAGADPIVAVDPVADKAALAYRLGATHVLPPSRELPRQVRALTGGRGADHAIECVGRSDSIRAAWSVTRRGGRSTVVGLGSAEDTVSFTALEVARSGRTISGCMYGNSDPAADLPVLVADYRAGQLDLTALISRTIPLSDLGVVIASAGALARTLVVFPPTEESR